MNTPPIIEHLEKYLGRIVEGWRDQQAPGVQVVLFKDAPSPGLVTLASIGLSRHELRMPKGRLVRQEVLLVAGVENLTASLAPLVLTISESAVEKHSALLRGQVFSLGEPIIPGSFLTHIYVTCPFFLCEEAQVLESSIPPTVLVSLIPISQAEARYVEMNGWSAFEDHLELIGEQLDLYNLKRLPTF